MRNIFLIISSLLLWCSSCAQVPGYSGTDPGSWMEMPRVAAEDSASLYSLMMEIDGVSQRNYSFLWNERHQTSDWVAYPLCRSNIGEGKRSNAFGLCPALPASRQPLLEKGYREGNSGWYSRGHQIPSADRLQYKANVATFYGINMTPQDENMNGGIWASLENKVRSWAMRCDTLYVVTGCTYDGWQGEYALDNRGRRVDAPTRYYKALLMLSRGKYYGCGFLYENRPYPDSKYHPEDMMPLSELEEAVGGVEFFPLLKDVAGDAEYSRIKCEDPQRQSVWRR